jgi:hypothetical protein
MQNPTATITTDEYGYLVSAEWAGVDRPVTYAIAVGQNSRNAERVAAAMEAGAFFANVRVATDINGATYVACDARVMGRHLNRDLARLGF